MTHPVGACTVQGCFGPRVHSTDFCFDHGTKMLAHMYAQRTAKAGQLLKLDTEIADLESALETR